MKSKLAYIQPQRRQPKSGWVSCSDHAAQRWAVCRASGSVITTAPTRETAQQLCDSHNRRHFKHDPNAKPKPAPLYVSTNHPANKKAPI